VGQHRNVIEAAKAAGVTRILYTSILKADRSPMLIAHDHRDTEALIAASGLNATIMRNGWYTENWTATLDGALEAGALIGAAGDARFSPATRRETYELIEVTREEQKMLGTNVLSLSPDCVVSRDDSVRINSEMRARGIEVIELPYSEPPKTGGSFRCCTLPLHRAF
jgi:NAD(P)H dehydrogenase (quinone)